MGATRIMPVNEYEKTNSLSRCDTRTIMGHVRRRTSIIVKGSYRATSSTTAT